MEEQGKGEREGEREGGRESVLGGGGRREVTESLCVFIYIKYVAVELMD
jgi:hypothetical protein